jgi:hypothetical protein
MAPHSGLAAWATADTSQPTTPIPPDLDVHVGERQGDWARVVCSNGWSAWVDGRQLIDVGKLQSDMQALVVRLDAALKEYQQVVTDAEGQRIDKIEFRRRALRAGMIESDDEVWLLDIQNGRWCRYDGFAVTTLDINKS